MTDVLDQQLREALTEQAAQLDHSASARLRALDYRPRRCRTPSRPAIGITGLAGATAAVGAVVALGSGAASAFAGWRASPTTPLPGQLAAAAQTCGSGAGAPVLTDTRGPYTASLYAEPNGSQLCISGNQISASQESSSSNPVTVAAGQVQLDGTGMRDASGDALTLVYGRVGDGVTAVTVDRSDGSSVQATVTNGWYLAWWPGSASATTAEVATASGTTDQSFPAAPNLSAPSCPSPGSSVPRRLRVQRCGRRRRGERLGRRHRRQPWRHHLDDRPAARPDGQLRHGHLRPVTPGGRRREGIQAAPGETAVTGGSPSRDPVEYGDERRRLIRRTRRACSGPRRGPQSRDRRRHFGRLPLMPALLAVGLAIAAAVAIAVVLLGTSTTPSAFAGWTRAPSKPGSGETATALARCGLGVPVLVDTRGPYTAAVYSERNGAGTCLQGPVSSESGTSAGGSVDEHTVATGRIQAFVTAASSGGSAATVLDGRVGRGVRAVAIDLSDGTTVTATVAHGWWLAWWPGRVRARRAVVTTATGAHPQALPAAATIGPLSCGRHVGCAMTGGPRLARSPRASRSQPRYGRERIAVKRWRARSRPELGCATVVGNEQVAASRRGSRGPRGRRLGAHPRQSPKVRTSSPVWAGGGLTHRWAPKPPAAWPIWAHSGSPGLPADHPPDRRPSDPGRGSGKIGHVAGPPAPSLQNRAPAAASNPTIPLPRLR